MPLEERWYDLVQPVEGLPFKLDAYPLKWIDVDNISRKKGRELTLEEARQWVARGRTLIIQEWEHTGLIPPDLADGFIEEHLSSVQGDEPDAKIFAYGRREGQKDTRIISIIFGYC